MSLPCFGTMRRWACCCTALPRRCDVPACTRSMHSASTREPATSALAAARVVGGDRRLDDEEVVVNVNSASESARKVQRTGGRSVGVVPLTAVGVVAVAAVLNGFEAGTCPVQSGYCHLGVIGVDEVVAVRFALQSVGERGA